jgi:hypothetical protein
MQIALCLYLSQGHKQITVGGVGQTMGISLITRQKQSNANLHKSHLLNELHAPTGLVTHFRQFGKQQHLVIVV